MCLYVIMAVTELQFSYIVLSPPIRHHHTPHSHHPSPTPPHTPLPQHHHHYPASSKPGYMTVGSTDAASFIMMVSDTDDILLKKLNKDADTSFGFLRDYQQSLLAEFKKDLFKNVYPKINNLIVEQGRITAARHAAPFKDVLRRRNQHPPCHGEGIVEQVITRKRALTDDELPPTKKAREDSVVGDENTKVSNHNVAVNCIVTCRM